MIYLIYESLKLLKSTINFQNVSHCEVFFKQCIVERVRCVFSHVNELRQQRTVVVFEPATAQFPNNVFVGCISTRSLIVWHFTSVLNLVLVSK